MTTALELTPEQLKKFIKYHRHRKPPSLTAAEISEREELIAQVREAALILRQKFNAKRVVLFGSLAHQAWFTPQSDVDIMVEGVNDYFQAWRVVEKIISKRSVDLIDWDMASEGLKRAVTRKGIEL